METARPPRGHPAEEPHLVFAGRPVALAALVMPLADARRRRQQVPGEVPTEGGAPGLLHVQEDQDIVAVHVEVQGAVEGVLREVVVLVLDVRQHRQRVAAHWVVDILVLDGAAVEDEAECCQDDQDEDVSPLA